MRRVFDLDVLTCPRCRMSVIATNRRIGRALQLLGQVASTGSERKAKRGVTLAMKQLQRSATIAAGAAKRGHISAACADAVGRAVGNARSQAEPLLGTRDG